MRISTDLPHLEVRSTFDSLRPYAPHFHSGILSVGLILRGSTLAVIDGTPLVANPGDIVLVGPGQVHSCNPVGGLARSYYMLHLDESWCRDMAGGRFRKSGALRPRQALIRVERLYLTLAAAADTIRLGGRPDTEDFAAHAARLVREWCLVLPARAARDARCARTQGRLAADIEARRSIAELAKNEGVRRETLMRSFRRAAGLSPSMYRHCLRLERGRQMLRAGEAIADTATALGYADQSHFHRMFVRFYSLTPGCYRKYLSLSFKK